MYRTSSLRLPRAIQRLGVFNSTTSRLVSKEALQGLSAQLVLASRRVGNAEVRIVRLFAALT